MEWIKGTDFQSQMNKEASQTFVFFWDVYFQNHKCMYFNKKLFNQ